MLTYKNKGLLFLFPPQAITTPAMAVSHIMLEAYKKYILVSLILHGKVQQLPKYTSQIVGRFIKVRLAYILWRKSYNYVLSKK